ncbi:unnamed protein product [Urochloa humidicola]
MAGLSDLDFAHGLEIQRVVRESFNSTISPPPSPSVPVFWLVASFGRSAIRLNVDSVGLILQSCLGGAAQDFQVLHLSGWMYRFSVSSKNVGFLIYHLSHFKCKLFAIFFALWGNGGPNWKHQYALWLAEQQAEWTYVSSGKKFPAPNGKKSYADSVRSKANAPLHPSVFRRLRFSPNYFQQNYGADDSLNYRRKSIFERLNFPNPRSRLGSVFFGMSIQNRPIPVVILGNQCL